MAATRVIAPVGQTQAAFGCITPHTPIFAPASTATCIAIVVVVDEKGDVMIQCVMILCNDS